MVTDLGASYTSSSQICDCPGKNTCPTDTNNSSRVYYQEMSSPDQTITTKLSYCNRTSIPVRECNQYETAVTLRGNEPLIASIVGNVTCKCPSPLVLHKAYPDPDEAFYSVREYTCGKSVCDVNTTTPSACERITLVDYSVKSEMPCQCPDGYICNVAIDLLLSDEPTEFYCKSA